MTTPLKRKSQLSWGIKLHRRTQVRNVTESTQLVKSPPPSNFYQVKAKPFPKSVPKRNSFRNPYQRLKRNILSKKDKSYSSFEQDLSESIKLPYHQLDEIIDNISSPTIYKSKNEKFERMSEIIEEEIDENGQPIEINYGDYDNNSEISQLAHLTRAAEHAQSQRSKELPRIEELSSTSSMNIQERVEGQQQLKDQLDLTPVIPPRVDRSQPTTEQIDDLLKTLTINNQSDSLSQWTKVQLNTNGTISPNQSDKMNQFEKYFLELSNKRSEATHDQNHIVMKSTCQVANINLETGMNMMAAPNTITLDPYSSLKLQDEMEKFTRNAIPKPGDVMKFNSRELKKYFELLQIKLADVCQFIHRDDAAGLAEFNFAFRDFIGHLNAVIGSVNKYGWVIGFLAPFLMKGNSAAQSCRLAFREACLILSNICHYQLADKYLVEKLWTRAWFLLIDVAQTPNGRDARMAYETLQTMMATAPLTLDVVYKLIISRTLSGSDFYDKSHTEFRCMRVSLLEVICFRLLQVIEQTAMQPQYVTVNNPSYTSRCLELLEYCKNEFDMTFQGENDMVVLEMIKNSGAVSAIRTHKSRMDKLQEYIKSPNLGLTTSQVSPVYRHHNSSHQRHGITRLLHKSPHRSNGSKGSSHSRGNIEGKGHELIEQAYSSNG